MSVRSTINQLFTGFQTLAGSRGKLSYAAALQAAWLIDKPFNPANDHCGGLNHLKTSGTDLFSDAMSQIFCS